jgi:hypothetical protein
MNDLKKQRSVGEGNQNAIRSWRLFRSIGAPFRPFPARVSGETSMRSSMGEDDVVTRQMEPLQPELDKTKVKWKLQIVAARIAWAKLTEDELIKLDGDRRDLAMLIEERYSITQNAAEMQVTRFFQNR